VLEYLDALIPHIQTQELDEDVRGLRLLKLAKALLGSQHAPGGKAR